MSKSVFDLTQVAPNKALHRPKIDIKNFTHVRGYHGGRPLDPQSYLRHGVLVGEIVDLKKQFREMFKDFPAETLEAAIQRSEQNRQYPEYDEVREVYFHLDSRLIVTRRCKYAIFGSEKIKDYAAELQNIAGIPCLERMKTIGSPSLVSVDIPMEEVPLEITEAIDEALAELAEGHYAEAYNAGPDIVDIAISFNKNVPTSWVVAVQPVHLDKEMLRLPD